MKFLIVISGALHYMNEHKAALTKALAWPFVALVLINATGYLEIGRALTFLIVIVSIGIQVIFVITTHRVILLGPDSVSKWGITSWTKRETVFVLHIIGLVLMAIPIMLLGYIPILGWVAALIVICWFASRFSLVFPGIATDDGVSFRVSWELTESHQILIFLVVIAFPLLLAIPNIILSSVPYSFFLSKLVSAFIIVFQVSALSIAYQLITTEVYENS